MLFTFVSLTLATLIMFLQYVMSIVYQRIDYSHAIPFSFITYLVVCVAIGIVFYIFHTNRTYNECEAQNKRNAFFTALRVTFYCFIWFMIIDYNNGLLKPFYVLFNSESEFMQIFAKSFMVYLLVFLLLTNTYYSSVKNACVASMDDIKEVYKEMSSKYK